MRADICDICERPMTAPRNWIGWQFSESEQRRFLWLWTQRGVESPSRYDICLECAKKIGRICREGLPCGPFDDEEVTP